MNKIINILQYLNNKSWELLFNGDTKSIRYFFLEGQIEMNQALRKWIRIIGTLKQEESLKDFYKDLASK